MNGEFVFINSSLADMDLIFRLFDSAIAYQKQKGFELWPSFGRAMIEKEIEERRHWKIMQNDQVACILSVMYNDPIIWGPEKDKDPAVYLHRITIHPTFKGRRNDGGDQGLGHRSCQAGT